MATKETAGEARLSEWLDQIRQWLAGTVGDARAVFRTILAQPRRLLPYGFVLLLGIGMGLIGPYGTYLHMPLIPRLLYWVSSVAISTTIWFSMEQMAFSKAPLARKHSLVTGLALTPIYAVFAPLAVVGFNVLIGRWGLAEGAAMWQRMILSWLVLSAFVIVPLLKMGRTMINVDAKAPEAQPQAQPLFIQRLRPHLRHAQLIALKAEDHYLRVFTDGGDDLVLFRLEDAISSLETIKGHHVHRSWWVAEDSIENVEQTANGLVLHLRGDLKVPVSRRRARTLQLPNFE